MAILTWAALRNKLNTYIKGESTGSLEKTIAVEHREYEADFIDTVESKISEAGAAAGATGDVQVKGSDGKATGSSSFNFLSGLLSLIGNLVIKGLSATLGYALEVKNSSNELVFSVPNSNGSLAFVKLGLRFGLDLGGYPHVKSDDGQQLDFSASLGQRFYSNNVLAFDTFPPGYVAQVRFYSKAIFDDYIQINEIRASDLNSGVRNLLIRSGNGFTTENSGILSLEDGQPTNGYVGGGVKISSWKNNGGTPLKVKIIEAKEDKLGFYGATVVAQQTLSADPTNAEISDVLFNLGLVIRP